jgi:zinc protease
MDCRKSIVLRVAVVTIIALGALAEFSVRPTYAEGNGVMRGTVQNGVMEQHVNGTSSGSWAHEQADLLPDQQAIFGRLDNGLRYVLLPNGKPKDRTSLHLVIQAGSLHETDEQRGIAHFLEHMLFNGSTHFPPGELVKYFQKIGMQFGPDANAHTGFFETVYDINLPVSDRQSLQEALQVIQDYAEGALLLPSEIERERGVILAEKQSRDSADYRAYVASLNFELAGTLFPDRLPIGNEDVIRSADQSVFKAFYDTWYRPDNMIVVMVGDFDPALARELVETQFADMAARAPARENPNIGQVGHERLKTFYHHEAELGSTSVTLQVLKHIAHRPDNAAYQRQQIEEQLANQILRNRLEREVNQTDSPITDASAGSGTFLRQIRYGYISSDCQPDNWQEALALIEQTLRQALDYGFNDDELERVKKDYLAGLDQAVAQARTRESGALARELIHSVSDDRVFRSPEQRKAFAVPIIAAATTKDLQDRLSAVWGQKPRLVLVTGNVEIGSSFGSPEDQIAAVFNASQATAVSQPISAPQAVFPYLPSPQQAGRIVGRKELEDIDVSLIRFENDIRLNFKPTDFTADEVQFVLSFGAGRAGVPLDMAALAAIVDEVMNESGLGQLDKEALAQALAGKKTDIQFGIRDDRFTLEGRSAPEEMELVFQLLQAYIVDPAFREDAWQLALNRYRQTYLSMRQSVDGVLNLYGWRFLAGGDPRFGLPPLDAFDGLSVADVERWVGPALRRGAMELSVVGDVDRETVVRLAARYLGSLPERQINDPKVNDLTGPVFPAARQMDVPVMSQVKKAQLIMAFSTDDIWDIGRTRRLNMLAEIVSERLRLQVREKLGAAYSPGAYSWPSRTYPGYGLFIIYIPLAPEMLDIVTAEVQAIIQDIRQNGLSSAELQRSLEPTLTGIKDRLRENGYWLNTVLAGASRHPVQLEWCRSIITDYAGIRKGDIERLARQYLDLSKLAVMEAISVGVP